MSRSSISLILIILSLMSARRADAVIVENLVDQPDEWFTTEEGKAVVDNIVTWQNPWGGWLKQYDASAPRPAVLPKRELPKGVPAGDTMLWDTVSTYDNSATTSELRILARAFRVTANPEYRKAFEKGLHFVFESQYANGGWPQRSPPTSDYGKHITFNDNAMMNVMRLLSDIVAAKPDFAFVASEDRAKAKAAFDRGVECILNCQIRINGKLTAWCQQHDAQTFAPAAARTYELPSICTYESAPIVMMLMEIPNPNPRVVAAVDSAAAWFESSKITGRKYEKIIDPKFEFGVDRVLKDDPSAPALWARFYDIDTNKPFFCDRDGVKRWKFEEVGAERRARYAWFNTSPQKVLDKYPKWKAQLGGADK